MGTLVDHHRTGLQVLSTDGPRLAGWVTHRDVLRAYAERVSHTVSEAVALLVPADYTDELDTVVGSPTTAEPGS